MISRFSVLLVVLCVLIAAEQYSVGLLAGWSNSTRSGGGGGGVGNASRDRPDNATDQDGSKGQDDTEDEIITAAATVVGLLFILAMLFLMNYCYKKNCPEAEPSEQSSVSSSHDPPRSPPSQSQLPGPVPGAEHADSEPIPPWPGPLPHPGPRQRPPGTGQSPPSPEPAPPSTEPAPPSPEPDPPSPEPDPPSPEPAPPCPVPDPPGPIPPPDPKPVPAGSEPLLADAGPVPRPSPGLVPQAAVQGRPRSLVIQAQVLPGSQSRPAEAQSVGDTVVQAADHSSPLAVQQAVPRSLSSQMDHSAVLEDCLAAQGQSRETSPSAQCSSPPTPKALVLGGEQHALDSLNVTDSTLLASFEPLLGKGDDVSETSM